MGNFQYGWIPQIYDQLKRRFATAAQGEKADSALQAASIGQSVEAHNDILTALAGLGDQTGLVQKTGAAAFGTFAQEATQILTAQIAQGRLTLASGDAVPSADQFAKTTLYYTPYNGNYISLWDGSNWVAYPFAETSLSLSGLAANTNYDIFAYAVDDTLTLTAVVWSSSGAGTSTRASAISQRNGIWVETSSDRRYLGTIRTTATVGECEDSLVKRYVFNAQNQIERNIYYRIPNAATNTYGTASWRYWNSNFYGFDIVVGLPQALTVFMGAGSTNNSVDAAGGGSFGVALDTATQPPTESIYPDLGGRADNVGSVFSGYFPVSVGYHYLAAVQLGYTNPTYSSAQVFYGTSGGSFIAGISTEVYA